MGRGTKKVENLCSITSNM